MGIVERMRGRASVARSENTGTSLGHASHFDEAADLIERLQRYAKHGKRSDGEACSAAWVKGAECDCGLNALIKEIEGD